MAAATDSPGVAIPSDRAATLFRSILACSLLSGLAVLGRFASRRVKKVPVGVADWMVVAGLLGAWIISGFSANGQETLGCNRETRGKRLTI